MNFEERDEVETNLTENYVSMYGHHNRTGRLSRSIAQLW